MRLVVVVVVSVSLGATAYGQQTKPAGKAPVERDWVQQIKELERLEAQNDALKAQLDAFVAQRQFKCMSAMGHQVFCQCLSQELPVSIDLPAYVAIAFTSKEEMGYSGLKPDEKSLVDTVLVARDKCVAKAFPPR